MPRTLLLADDSITMQKVVSMIFAHEDFTIATASDGHEAIAKARELQPAIVVADVVMPGPSGYDVCEALRSDPSTRHIPVLLLTGTFEEFDHERAAQVGADGHIAKPFESAAIIEAVKKLAGEAGRPAAAAPATAAAPSRIPSIPMPPGVKPLPPLPTSFAQVPVPPMASAPSTPIGVDPLASATRAPAAPRPVTPGPSVSGPTLAPAARGPITPGPANPFAPGAPTPAPFAPVAAATGVFAPNPPGAATPAPFAPNPVAPSAATPAPFAPIAGATGVFAPNTVAPNTIAAPPSLAAPVSVARPVDAPPAAPAPRFAFERFEDEAPADDSLGRTPGPFAAQPFDGQPPSSPRKSTPIAPVGSKTPGPFGGSALFFATPGPGGVNTLRDGGAAPSRPDEPARGLPSTLPTSISAPAGGAPEPLAGAMGEDWPDELPDVEVAGEPANEAVLAAPASIEEEIALEDDPWDVEPLEVTPVDPPRVGPMDVTPGPAQALARSTAAEAAPSAAAPVAAPRFEIPARVVPSPAPAVPAAAALLETPAPAVPSPAPAAPPTAALAVGAPSPEAPLSEASKELLERIGWEVVPQVAEAIVRERITAIAKDAIERIAWEIVPQLAESILRSEVERQIRERRGG